MAGIPHETGKCTGGRIYAEDFYEIYGDHSDSCYFLILFINFLFRWHMLEDQQFSTFHIKIEQIIHMLENNQMELD